jgi:hypothetical protein
VPHNQALHLTALAVSYVGNFHSFVHRFRVVVLVVGGR